MTQGSASKHLLRQQQKPRRGHEKPGRCSASRLAWPFIGSITWGLIFSILSIFESTTWQPGDLLLQFRSQYGVVTAIDLLWLALLTLGLGDLLLSARPRKLMLAVPYVIGIVLVCLIQATALAMFHRV